jgi:RimJ/RimL family protein N-acetyltransferase
MKFPDDVPTLTNGDITLRAHRLDDAEAAVEQSTDPTSIRWTTVPLNYTLDDARRFVGEIMPGGWESESEFGFAIETTHPGGERRYSGTLSLRDEGSRRAELAFGAHPAIRGRGVMSAAVTMLLDWGFKSRDLETVIWLANRGNVASRRVAWKAGFTFGGTVRRWLDHRGEYPDAWIASVHRDDDPEPKTRWLGTPVIAGQNVVLRPLREDDVPSIVAGCRDPRSRQFLPFLPDPYTDQDALDWLVRNVEQASLGTGVNWAMADPATDRHLGNIGLPRLGPREAEIGYWAHPDARGRGLTSEAVGLLIRHAFIDVEDGGLGFHRVFLKAAGTNPASQHIARVNGMTECGRERRAELLGDGSADDLVVFDLLREEWMSQQGVHTVGHE